MNAESIHRDERKFLRVPEFEKMQNPKRPTKPTWIKSFVGDLDDLDWLNLSIANRGFLSDFQKLAATMSNRVPYDVRFIAGRLHIKPHIVGKAVVTCISAGMLAEFAEDTETSKNKTLDEKIATPPIPLEGEGEGEVDVDIPSPSCDERTPKGGYFNGDFEEINKALNKEAKRLDRGWVEPDDTELRELTEKLLGEKLADKQWEKACQQVEGRGNYR